ncbi:NAD(P)-binding protein [Auriscalpium vulgare]|uniref:NAD(P)-binding protein n=1 Tax=Auriscalpium vulgare TaxID=40419 RepID=A0ACB8SBL3_9AGAM|nr:NAD(P)-binding protein [Auriscalpium vulgare]
MSRPLLIITGASRGLGLAVATILLSLDAAVVAISRSRTPELDKLAAAHPDSLQVVQCDVTDEPAFVHAIESVVSKHGGIDGLVLNAGSLDPLGRIAAPEIKLDQWRTHFDVNFFSLVTALKAAVPALRASARGGRVVFISSGSATGKTEGWAPYNASKAALNSLNRTLAEEEKNIVSVALRPGKVDTAMQAALRETGRVHMTEEDYNTFVREHTEGKLVKPEDAGYVIAKLALEAPASLSGQFVSWNSDECKAYMRPP